MLPRMQPDTSRPGGLRIIPDVLLAEDVAAVLGVSVVHARRLLGRGTIPSRKRGRRRYVLRAVFLAWLAPERPGSPSRGHPARPPA